MWWWHVVKSKGETRLVRLLLSGNFKLVFNVHVANSEILRIYSTLLEQNYFLMQVKLIFLVHYTSKWHKSFIAFKENLMLTKLCQRLHIAQQSSYNKILKMEFGAIYTPTYNTYIVYWAIDSWRTPTILVLYSLILWQGSLLSNLVWMFFGYFGKTKTSGKLVLVDTCRFWAQLYEKRTTKPKM